MKRLTLAVEIKCLGGDDGMGSLASPKLLSTDSVGRVMYAALLVASAISIVGPSRRTSARRAGVASMGFNSEISPEGVLHCIWVGRPGVSANETSAPSSSRSVSFLS